MNYILDVILVIIFFLVVIISTTKGFVKCVWSIVALIGALVISYIYGPMLGSWIGNAVVNDYVATYTHDAIETIVKNNSENEEYDISSLLDEVPEELVALLESCRVDIEEIVSDYSHLTTLSGDQLHSIADSIALPVAKTISNISGVIIVFLASLLFIGILGLILRLVVKFPIIKSLDTVLGMFLGVAEGFIIVWILCLVIEMIVERGFMFDANSETFRSITDSSYLLKYFCDLSLIDIINVRIE